MAHSGGKNIRDEWRCDLAGTENLPSGPPRVSFSRSAAHSAGSRFTISRGDEETPSVVMMAADWIPTEPLPPPQEADPEILKQQYRQLEKLTPKWAIPVQLKGQHPTSGPSMETPLR